MTELGEHADVFDVGCGNDSPYLFKSIRPDIRYVGLDVGDYYQEHEPAEYADDYVVVPVSQFLNAIQQRAEQFDAVVSAHNLEHCDDPDNVVKAMAQALRPGGRLYLAFPSAASLSMPSRQGTLNFFDDTTHVRPPDFQNVLRLLRAEGVTIDFAAERYRPPSRVVIGALNEPVSRMRKQVMRGTWALYGFETVIWGRKR
ncbi:SAM-dependent methyltransferase [Mycolicibacterium sp. BK556]|uniref:class I SAM-dependent methyltransferase n=1 Tax=Mycolicibacterium sp. BK556 TaxID=2587125 RepID=UPI00141509C3|nr:MULTISPECIES: class I SAM-dependent methyltransferase [Mycobacteriaceae]MBB3606991.1 SAM-dependent methyltransferase [Mycolicibacterium sp. BK556]MBB3747597.1 SAM-dependent methyltransferase [Mycolicibacterium sp. BK634]